MKDEETGGLAALAKVMECASTWLRVAEEEFEKQMPDSLAAAHIEIRRQIHASRQNMWIASNELSGLLADQKAEVRE